MKLKFCYLLMIFLISCTKEKVSEVDAPPEKQWQKFIGNYKVFDTSGIYLFDTQISHFSIINEFGVEVDSILIQNFADTMDLKFNFSYNTNLVFFDIRIHDSIGDYNNKSWHVSRKLDDPITPFAENELHNDTMILYFKMTNLKYYINESVPYFDCNCKHIYVKQ